MIADLVNVVNYADFMDYLFNNS